MRKKEWPRGESYTREAKQKVQGDAVCMRQREEGKKGGTKYFATPPGRRKNEGVGKERPRKWLLTSAFSRALHARLLFGSCARGRGRVLYTRGHVDRKLSLFLDFSACARQRTEILPRRGFVFRDVPIGCRALIVGYSLAARIMIYSVIISNDRVVVLQVPNCSTAALWFWWFIHFIVIKVYVYHFLYRV